MAGKTKPKAKGTSKAPRARKPATKSPSRPKSKPPPKPKAGAAKAATPRAKGAPGGGDWREATLARMRALILESDPGMVEERKWRKASNAMAGVPVWSHDGIVCTGETYKDKVKLTFAKGAALPDPTGLFNAADKGSTRRAIDLLENDAIDTEAFKALVRAAVALNGH